MSEYTIKPLGPATWDDFADLAGRHNGVWNGCWCTWFHTFYSDKVKDRTAQDNRDAKQQRVNEGRAHATRGLFEQAGFAYDRPKGKNHCVMSKVVAPA